MRAGLASSLCVAATLTLAGCATPHKVTLLTHSDGGPVGSVAVLGEDGAETVLDQVNQQARLTRGGARLRQLDQPDPAHVELIGSLPAPPSPLVLTDFPTGRISLSDAQITSIRQHFQGLEDRPGYQIEIRGYTDSEGSEGRNRTVSQGRADGVAEIIRGLGFEVAPEDVIGMSEFEAVRRNGDGFEDPGFRRVDIVIR